MKIALYSRNVTNKTAEVIAELLDIFKAEGVLAIVHVNIKTAVLTPSVQGCSLYVTATDLKEHAPDFMISIGGDGSLLDTVTYVKDMQVPVFGINTGRLGFLAGVSRDIIHEAISDLIKGHFELEPRSLLSLNIEGKEVFGENNLALNDCVIYKNHSSSMIMIRAFLNGEYLNSYWSDGIIVSTPTGSTGYSLSCGGPILFPSSSSLAITPIAPHNLNVRPIIISDENVISLEVETRSATFMVSMDSRTAVVDSPAQMAIKKSDNQINILRFKSENYLETLRNKLMWGVDSRN
jgi:NAD+ kinase